MSVKRSSRRQFVIALGAGAVGVAASAIVVACGGAPAAPTSAPAATKPAETKPAAGGATAPAGAAAPTQPAAAGGAPAPAAKPAAGGGAKVQITFSHYLDPAAAKAYDDILAKEWGAKYPNIDVKVDISPEGEFTGKMLTQFGGGNYSDVVMVTDRYVPDFASRDVLLDLNPNIKRDDSSYDFKDLNEDLVQSGNWGGKQVAIFDYTGPIVIYYNKRLFREAGVEPPKDKGLNWTFDEFHEVAKKLTRGEGEKRVWASEGYQTGFCFQTYATQALGGKLVDHRGPAPADKVNWHWNTPETRKSLEMQNKWTLTDKTVPIPGAVQGDPFQAQRVAMKIVAGRWLGPLYTSFSWSDDLGMLHQPLGTAPRQSRNGPRGLMIPKGSKNQDAAWNFIEFITNKEGMQLLFRLNYGTPARKSLWPVFKQKWLAKGEDGDIYEQSQKIMSELGALPTYPKFAAVNKVLTDNLNAMWLGQQSLDDTLKKLDADCNAQMKAP